MTSREAFERALSAGAWDIVLSDYRGGGFGALEALALLKERETDMPFIVVSEEIGEETAVQAIKAGAHNCIPLSALGHLAATVERELREGQIRRERRQAREALRESESRFRVLVNNAPIVLFAFDRDGVVTHLEGRGLEPLGLRPGETVGRSAFELAGDSPKALQMLRRALDGEAFQETVELRNLVFEVDFAPRRDEQGAVLDVIGVATNVTDQRRAERAANQSEIRYRMLFEGNLAGVYRTTLEGKILDCNDSFAQIFGYSSRDEVLSLPAWDFYPTPEDRTTALARLKERGTLANFEQRLRRKDGSHVWVLENGNLIEGTDGKPSLIEGTVIDITERKRSEEQVKHLAFHDSLTGLPNRLLFNDRLRVAMVHANRYRQKLAVLFLDIDRFKVINDSLGHPIGDELLRRIAERVGGCIRQEDTIARLGGDEFTVLLPGIAKEEDAATIANKILEAVRLPFFIEHRELFITTSIGVTLFPEDGTDPESLVRNADTAMYRAKEQGRDTTRLYAPAMNTKALERLSLEGRLRQALQNQELIVHYQPLIDLATGRVRGAEALLRWQHPELGLVAPGEFIAIAEVSGLIVPIGQWVLRTACAQARAWQLQGHPKFSVAVNLSARQFQQADLVFQVTEALHEAERAITWETGLPHVDVRLVHAAVTGASILPIGCPGSPFPPN